jgi:chromosome segregation protein
LPVSFSRLRIAGFKSFAEPAVVEILPGLTGIVGPNGCGKSNVVEALCWAMGENSARSLRGGEMDDVIFVGTSLRPARNIAEVTLQLEETRGLVPPPFHEAPELEVSRRIERGGGSVFRVNGREARARDVQTLFADLASGARASAILSQGRVGAIVSAKPEERRSILEEAAGVTGLHARRHEAELKLRAAEANLARAEDLRGQLQDQVEALKRQARQANRYRNLSATIRQAEAELLAIQRAKVDAARLAAQQALDAANAAVSAATAAATAAGARAATAAAALPTLRETEAESRTALERHRLAGEQLAAEEARAKAALEAAGQRLQLLARDLGHAEQGQRDAVLAMDRLAAEDARLAAEEAAHPAKLERAEAAAVAAADAARAAEAEANRATERAAELAARHAALTDALQQAEQRARRLEEQSARQREERARVAEQLVDPARLQRAATERDTAEQTATVARIALEQAEQARGVALAAATQSRNAALAEAERSRNAAGVQARRLCEAAVAESERLRADATAALAAARARATAAETARAKLAAEAEALAEVLAVKDNERWPRMVDQLAVPAGLESALGAALGEELDCAADTSAARHWRELPPLAQAPALPPGVQPLAGLVAGPPALARALSQIGLTEDGAALQPTLAAGQVLVSKAGAVWRWDGYTIQAGTPTAAAVRLQQRNRLAGLRTRQNEAEQQAAAASAVRAAAEAADRVARTEAEAAERTARARAESIERDGRAAAEAVEKQARAAAEAAERAANSAEQQARTARRDAEQRRERTGAAADRLAAQAAAATARMAGLDEQAARLQTELTEATLVLRRAREARDALADPAEGRAAMEQARSALAAARSREAAARNERDGLVRVAAGRGNRRRALAAEAADWRQRADDAGGRVTDLGAREAQARAELTALQAAPAAIAARRASALDALETAEARHRAAADALRQAESEASAADRAARAAEAALAAARERVVRAEGEATQAEQARAALAERILERLGMHPALPDPPADIGAETEDKARRRLERLQREREDMGPVNLRAEVEAEAIGRQIEAIVRGREELTTAIAKLRGSIGHLNREGRERLAAVFTQVDQHFQGLFTRMFGGGRAHLAMVGSDDPLAAGLEIYAQPPGKKLAALSLLSGGEQALTALSLIFAVFRCNPAPVCVLDEVDAPLDDANVDRFCALLDDMVREAGTRFLVVTHHPLTMARMDRLYGVTMQERGVSRLLSVDLAQASVLVDPERIAAE